jgi:hypothetical protein
VTPSPDAHGLQGSVLRVAVAAAQAACTIDELIAPTPARACGCGYVSSSAVKRSDEGVGMFEQLVRVQIKRGWLI